ncbi:PREDICTED: polycystic kidney disease protein 1-like 3 [Gekko japonicus]|uniref:Polycystic kidney disease protein 1-like 3 n=1 Tax=Gekko japonicus TaxID=146911 RepID=A0ABM1LCK7_GEKJA|nr:PREDICTED: polycystic kidney disease protein 1-like 3 [Gekko japonicus]
MELPLGLWLWLHVASLPHQPLTGEAGYRLVRWPQSFPAAQAWCWLHGGSLLHSWDRHTKAFLLRSLNSESKSWIAPNAEVPRAPEEAGPGQGLLPECLSITRMGDQFWAREEACSKKLPFICQSGEEVSRGGNRPPEVAQSGFQPPAEAAVSPGPRPQPTRPTTAKGPGSPPPHSTVGPVTLSPRDVPPEDKGEALEQLLRQFNQTVPALGHSLAVERASRALRDLTSSPASLSEEDQPKPLTVTFPSASALAPLLSRHGQAPLQVQVASFALDPFQPLGGKAMASVASVAIHSSSEGPVGVHGLLEEIEILLGGEGEVEGSATRLNGSSGQFSMEVNVTSLEDALLVSVRPAAPLRITLHLASLPEAHHGRGCLLNTTLPNGSWQEEGAYVWVVPPEELRQRLHGPGTYSLSAVVASQAQGPSNVSVALASTGCYHWASQEQAWRSDGCRVGPRSTLRQTQCLCSHLTFLGRFLVFVPHVIDLQRTGQLLSQVGQNPVGLALLCSLLLAYGALLLWALRRQKADRRKVTVTVLAGHAGSASCRCYLVQVFTGYRRGAATSAKVVLTLYGAEGRSEPLLLQHPQAPSLETGGMDAFLLTTQQPLGALHAIRLWHDNSGASPSWFVHRLVVSDLAARKKWYFPCACWLAADMEDGQADKVFVAASDRELRSFGYLFWTGLVEKLTQEHLWLSVVTCSAWSPFTRVQRLSCCLALLLCAMLVNIMFWRGAAEEEEQARGSCAAGLSAAPSRALRGLCPLLAGPLVVVTWQELVVSLEAAVILLPLHLLILHIFRWVQPPALEPPPPPPPPPAVDPQLPQLEPSKQLPTITPLQQELTETVGFLYKNPLCRCQDLAEFPGTWKQVPELVAGLCALVRSSLRQLEEDPERLVQERSSTLHGYLCHVVHDLEAQLRSLDGHSLQNPYDHLHALDQLHRLQQQLQQLNPQLCVKQPRLRTSPEMQRQRVQLTFLAVLMVLCYAERSPSEFHLNDALQKSFTRHVGNIRHLEQLYSWARRTLLPSLYSEGPARDASAFLVGSVRLRQIRAEETGPAFFWPRHEDDRGCPRPHWGPRGRAQENAWVYQSETTLAEYPTRGTFAVYPGGGYLADLGRNASHANRILHALAQDKWLDQCTTAVLVEFTVYNANVNLFCAVTVMLESNGPGAVASSTALQILRLYPSSQMLVPLACAHLAFLLLLLYDIVAQGRGLKRQRWRHFRAKGNLLDAFSVLISLTVVGLYVRRGLLAASVLREHRQDRSRFLRVSEVANTDAALTYLIAFLVALTTVKLWNLLRLNPRMHLVTRTLQKAWDEIPGFLLTLLVLLIGYAFACNLLFGWSIVNFKTFSDSAVTIVGLLAGIFNYEAVLALDPVLGSLLLVTSILSMVFVVLNLLVSALLTVFSREMKAVSEEESMVQLVQLKISSLLGIKQGPPVPACGGAAED